VRNGEKGAKVHKYKKKYKRRSNTGKSDRKHLAQFHDVTPCSTSLCCISPSPVGPSHPYAAQKKDPEYCPNTKKVSLQEAQERPHKD
jgi:hypothetical protein